MVRFISVIFLVVAACSGSPIAPQILGGSDADIADFPYMVSIQVLDFFDHCGGFIISPNWALTDASCVSESANITHYLVRNGTLHSVVQWIDHPQYNVAYNEYDFALFQVDPPFEFGENVAAVALAAQDQETPDLHLVSPDPLVALQDGD